jgi:hypothetical protein
LDEAFDIGISNLSFSLGESASPEVSRPATVADAVQAPAPQPPISKSASVPEGSVMPPVPESLDELAIAPEIIEQLVLKYLYFRVESLDREIAVLLGLTFSLIDELM